MYEHAAQKMVRYAVYAKAAQVLHSMLQQHTCLRWTLSGGGGCHATPWLLPLTSADFSLQCGQLHLLVRAHMGLITLLTRGFDFSLAHITC